MLGVSDQVARGDVSWFEADCLVDVLHRRRMIDASESHADALTRLEVMKMTFFESSARNQTHELERRTFKTLLDAVQPNY